MLYNELEYPMKYESIAYEMVVRCLSHKKLSPMNRNIAMTQQKMLSHSKISLQLPMNSHKNMTKSNHLPSSR